MSKNISINVPILARVEGEGALEVKIRDNKIKTLKLKIYEPPRLFEKFLEARSYTDVLDFVARICGICPVAYQMSATQAIENCFGIQPTPWVRSMRRLFYCGEWLESHSMHIHFLALPDFLGFKSAPEMAKIHPEEVRRGMRLQAFGNDLIKLFGGRSVHPVGACVGGFYKAPSFSEINLLLEIAKERVEDCDALIRWLAGLNLPNNSHEFTYVSLYHPTEYPFNEGRLVSNQGLNISIDEFDAYFTESQVPYSNALHCLLQNKPYLVGPLARVNNCFGHLPTPIHLLLQNLNINFPSNNMYQSIIARAVEIYYCVLESIRILEQYETPQASFPHEINPRSGIGIGCTEAPRGFLWQHYRFDKKGQVKTARIVPPTSQNQARIEEDLSISLSQFGLDKDEDSLRSYSEMIIRNYDPCISCSTHFLHIKVSRE
ncbi:Ni/Fe hydrogenase subunit alpha [Legionella parisiensis]|uniref:NAD-reducing hydrogenase HoxS subunit beta n=1 Tax=Legionella parisiensis TaxID=45071 RepID=A0A1E5JRP3_9GAMM|nr:Ni/Fe hydrogenase subunit alpha [Legionella parisiensis]KTD40564.1 coenzyme F420-reducing hydrogenase, alpha subunit [Legionella parisiensis]OEH47201.1 NAD-reducing hydrogenase HoxS subunit beta [Legionella parisiensis]STX77043.1 coenzyme F420-reducing hydrogenase, alpha subunit [Legionella parisiensis]